MAPIVDPIRVLPDQKIPFFVAVKIGYTYDGQFDPHHEDFYVCCSCIHIHKVVIVSSMLGLLLEAAALVFFLMDFDSGTKGDWFTLMESVVALGVFVVLFVGCLFWRKCYKLLRIFFFISLIEAIYMIGYFAVIIASVIVVLNKDKASHDQEEHQYLIAKEVPFLFEAVGLLLQFVFNIWMIYVVYIEYRYLHGRVKHGLT